jgi:hypothetical protein
LTNDKISEFFVFRQDIRQASTAGLEPDTKFLV